MHAAEVDVRHMKQFVIYTLILISLVGCVPTKVWLYRSVNEAGRYEKRYQGLLNVSYGEQLLENNGFSIVAGKISENEFLITLQLSVEKGATIELESWGVQLSSPEFAQEIDVPLNNMFLSVYGRGGKPGYYKYIMAGEKIVGRAENETLGQSPKDAYTTTVLIAEKAPATLTITLPVFLINDERVVTSPIEFELIESLNYVYSLQ